MLRPSLIALELDVFEEGPHQGSDGDGAGAAAAAPRGEALVFSSGYGLDRRKYRAGRPYRWTTRGATGPAFEPFAASSPFINYARPL